MGNSIRRTLAEDRTATVTVCGEIDFSNADDVADCVRAALGEWPVEVIQIELGEATFVDSTGLGALIEGYRAATESGVRFMVVNPTRIFYRVLTVTGLTELFGLTEPVAEIAQTREVGA
ncbi:MAG: STAS domain-containing protein [Actinoplanes sp.]